MIVNNNEYTLQPLTCYNSQTTTFVFTDYLNLTADSAVDFTLFRETGSSSFTPVVYQSPYGGGLSYRSLVLIQRLK